jgi:hypothetical protein
MKNQQTYQESFTRRLQFEMTFPAVKSCIVCESVRFERDNKLSILGMYGFAPEVDIRVQLGTGQPLAFVLDIPQTSITQVDIAGALLNPSGSRLLTLPSMAALFNPSHKRSFLSLSILVVRFTEAGIHTLMLEANGEEVYRADFNVVAKRVKPLLDVASLPAPQ